MLGLTDHPLVIEVGPNSPPPPISHTLRLAMSEDAWNGDAQFIVKVDGTQVGGTDTVSAVHGTGAANVFTHTGTWGLGQHTVQIQFINDAYGGTPTTDRNLYVNSIAYDGTTYANTTATMLGNGTSSCAVGGTNPAAIGPADLLTVHLSEDAYKGDANFTLSIDGKRITTPQAVTALHSTAALQDFSFAGSFGAGSHNIGITFTNDAYGGTPTTDRNLYVSGLEVNGQHYGNGTTTLLSAGTAFYTIATAH